MEQEMTGMVPTSGGTAAVYCNAVDPHRDPEQDHFGSDQIRIHRTGLLVNLNYSLGLCF